MPRSEAAEVAAAVERLAEGLKGGGLIRPAGSDRFRLFVADVETGESAPIVDEPEKGRTRCGSPCWSPDGRRIVFDAIPLDLRQLSRIEALGLVGGEPRIADVGPGRFPNISPDGGRIAYSLVPKTASRDAPGVWSMRGDGSGRRWLGAQGRPLWSPDGRRILVVEPGASPSAWMMDVDGEDLRAVEIPDRRIFATLVASIGRESAEAIAVIDVADPERAAVAEILWERSGPRDPVPGDVAYSAEAGTCAFAGAGPEGMAIYTLTKGSPAPPRRLGRAGFDAKLGDLAFSPGGRYLLFHSDNPDRPRGRLVRAGGRRVEPGAPAEAAAELVAALDRAPVLRPYGTEQSRVFLMDLPGGESRPVLDEPAPRLSFCGSLSWSDDGRRILMDASPIGLYQAALIRSVELADGRPVVVDIKPGNCPSLSADGRRIAYLANPGGYSTEEPGAWIMQADGTDPRSLGVYGAPHWSPDGRILITSFGAPAFSILDPRTGRGRRLLMDKGILELALEWCGVDVLGIVAVGPTRRIALIDVAEPGSATVKDVLWDGDESMTPTDAVYDPQAGRCIFTAAVPGGVGIYMVERGKPGPPTRLYSEGRGPSIADLAISPDGRYLLFRSNNPDRGRAASGRP